MQYLSVASFRPFWLCLFYIALLGAMEHFEFPIVFVAAVPLLLGVIILLGGSDSMERRIEENLVPSSWKSALA